MNSECSQEQTVRRKPRTALVFHILIGSLRQGGHGNRLLTRSWCSCFCCLNCPRCPPREEPSFKCATLRTVSVAPADEGRPASQTSDVTMSCVHMHDQSVILCDAVHTLCTGTASVPLAPCSASCSVRQIYSIVRHRHVLMLPPQELAPLPHQPKLESLPCPSHHPGASTKLSFHAGGKVENTLISPLSPNFMFAHVNISKAPSKKKGGKPENSPSRLPCLLLQNCTNRPSAIASVISRGWSFLRPHPTSAKANEGCNTSPDRSGEIVSTDCHGDPCQRAHRGHCPVLNPSARLLTSYHFPSCCEHIRKEKNTPAEKMSTSLQGARTSALSPLPAIRGMYWAQQRNMWAFRALPPSRKCVHSAKPL